MFTYEMIARAVSRNDAVSGAGTEAVHDSLGIDGEAMHKAAEQRALRMVLLRKGVDIEKLQADGVQIGVSIGAAGMEEMASLGACWVDGFAAALRLIQDHEVPEQKAA